MLPVSGAPQLNISGAIIDRPIISQRWAYSTFVSPEIEGKNRLNNPAFFAFSFKTSIS